MNENEIVLDPASGISVEEQNEILTQINGIAEKNRRHLSEKEFGDDKNAVVNAKKSGAFFPLAVNIAAVIVLCAGAFFLIQCNSTRNAQIRTGRAVDLELAGTQQGFSDELELAMRELERLTTEQERVDAVDAMISGGLITVSGLIQENQFDQAALEVEELRQFLNNNFLASLHAFQSRKAFYNQLFDFADTLIEDARRQFDLILLNIQLEEAINDLQMSINFLETQRETLVQTVETRDGTITSLRYEERNLNHAIAERNSEITTLIGERNNLTQNLAVRDNTIMSLETQRNTLNQTLATRDSTIASLETQRNTLNQTLAARDSTIASLETQRNTLNQNLAARDSTIASLETQRNTLNQNLAARDEAITSLRNENAELQQTLTALRQIMGL